MLLKGFALILLILIPFIIFLTRNRVSIAKILFLLPTHSSSPTFSPTSVPLSPVHTDSSDFSTATPGSVTSTVSPSSVSEQNTGNIGDFVYPGSTVGSQNASSTSLSSSDDPTQITNWYKNVITQRKMTTTSFIITSTNGNVSNKLVAANGDEQIQIAIGRLSGSNMTTIAVLVRIPERK